jgi:hypothetical protein
MQGGVKAELNIGKLLGKRAGVIATALRSRPVDGPDGKGAIVAQVRRARLADDRGGPGTADRRGELPSPRRPARTRCWPPAR